MESVPVTPKKTLSLLDVAGLDTADWHVIYMNRAQDYWWAHHLKDGFQHVWLAKPVQYGPLLSDQMWLRIDPCLPFIHADVFFHAEAPWVHDHSMTVQRVTCARPATVREWFALGPPSCVEIAKAFLGINKFWLRTPWQLYQYIHARGGVIVSR